MTLIIALDSDPRSGQLYRQGLEIAMIAADCGADCLVVLESAFADRARAAPEADFVRRLGQLELLGIGCAALEAEGLPPFVGEIPAARLRALIEAGRILVF